MNEWIDEEKELRTPEHDRLLLHTLGNIENILIELKLLKDKNYIFEKNIEYPLRQGYNFRFIDLFIKANLKELGKEHFFYEFYIEIKPEIKSIGEVIRQINLYKKLMYEGTPYIRDRFFIIITKTKGLKELFKEQNIYIYETD